MVRERLVWWSFLLVTVAVAPCARSVRATTTPAVAHASAASVAPNACPDSPRACNP